MIATHAPTLSRPMTAGTQVPVFEDLTPLHPVDLPKAEAANHPPVIDVEHHVSATMLWHTPVGRVTVNFERASCVHGPELNQFTLEGTRAGANFEWLNWGGPDRLTITGDDGGKPVARVFEFPHGDIHAWPVQAMAATLRGESVAMVAGDRALFNFNVLRAIYATAERGTAVSVTLEKSNHA